MTNRVVARHRTSGLSPEFALLGFLDQSPAHGYELHRKLVEELGEIWHASLSQTYNILARLEAQGYIEGTTQAQEKRPDKRELRLTTAGRERFETWLHTLTPSSVHAIRVDFLTRLYFRYSRDPGQARRAIEAQVEALKNALVTLQQKKQALPPERVFNQMGISLRISQLEMVITWLETCFI